MLSKTEVANRALSKLGEQRVSNVDTDNTKAAKVIRYMWDIERNAFMAQFPWNFAIKRAQIAKDGTSPSWGFDNRYLLPSDFLALLRIKGDPEYRIEGSYILTNDDSPIYIKYIRLVEAVGEWDPLFATAFASRLALEGCEEITQSNTKKNLLARELAQNIKDAYANDSIQDPPQELPLDSWLESREAGLIRQIDYNADA